jgi:hypothetical protein
MHSPVTFEGDLTEVFLNLRRALREMIDAAGADISAPGEVARLLGLNRNLTWKLAKVVGEADIYAALQHLPGQEGLEIVASTLGRAGVAPSYIEAFKAAIDAFEAFVRQHAGDRNTFDLILDGMAGAGSGEYLEQSRKLAFRGNSGLWGLQCKVRSSTNIIAPNRDDPDMLDVCRVAGVVGFRRLRPGIRWPLFRPRQYHDDGTTVETNPNEESLDPSAPKDSPGFLRDFCSNMPQIHALPGRNGWDIETGDGPVGNLGAFTCFFGRLVRKTFPRYFTPRDPYLTLLCNVTMPVETMHFDVIVHKELESLGSPRVMLLASFDGSGIINETQSMPLDARPVELSGRPPMLGTPLIPRYDELTSFLFARGGWKPWEFRAHRLTIKYQPMHSVAALKYDLPVRDQPGPARTPLPSAASTA